MTPNESAEQKVKKVWPDAYCSEREPILLDGLPYRKQRDSGQRRISVARTSLAPALLSVVSLRGEKDDEAKKESTK